MWPTIKRLAMLRRGAKPNNVLEAALRKKLSGGGHIVWKTIGPADILTVTDAVAAPAQSLIAHIAPIQDLNGYDSPWPAGGGVNKFDKDAAVQGKWLNVSTGAEEPTSDSYALSDWIPVKSGTAYSFTNPSSSRRWFYDTTKSPVEAVGTNPYTPSADGYIRITISLISVSVDTFMVVEGSSLPQTYSPYSNICPITGRTGVNVVRTGGNLLDSAKLIDQAGWNIITLKLEPSTSYTMSTTMPDGTGLALYFKTTNSGGGSSSEIVYSGHPVTQMSDADGHLYISQRRASGTDSFANYDWQIELGSTASPYTPYVGTTYSVVFPALGRNIFDIDSIEWTSGTRDDDGNPAASGSSHYTSAIPVQENTTYTFSGTLKTSSSTWRVYFLATDGTWIERTGSIANVPKDLLTPAGCGYVQIQCNNSLDLADVQIELGSESHAFEPYTNTLYGGTVDVVSGVLTVTKGEIASYSGEALPAAWISDRDVYAAGTTPSIGAQVVYELAMPVTIQLTAQEASMLKGVNTVWADCGQTEMTYAAKTSGELDEDQLMLLGAIQQGLVRPGTVSLDGVDLSRLDLSRIDGIGTLDPIDIQPIKPGGGIKA